MKSELINKENKEKEPKDADLILLQMLVIKTPMRDALRDVAMEFCRRELDKQGVKTYWFDSSYKRLASSVSTSGWDIQPSTWYDRLNKAASALLFHTFNECYKELSSRYIIKGKFSEFSSLLNDDFHDATKYMAMPSYQKFIREAKKRFHYEFADNYFFSRDVEQGNVANREAFYRHFIADDNYSPQCRDPFIVEVRKRSGWYIKNTTFRPVATKLLSLLGTAFATPALLFREWSVRAVERYLIRPFRNGFKAARRESAIPLSASLFIASELLGWVSSLTFLGMFLQFSRSEKNLTDIFSPISTLASIVLLAIPSSVSMMWKQSIGLANSGPSRQEKLVDIVVSGLYATCWTIAMMVSYHLSTILQTNIFCATLFIGYSALQMNELLNAVFGDKDAPYPTVSKLHNNMYEKLVIPVCEGLNYKQYEERALWEKRMEEYPGVITIHTL